MGNLAVGSSLKGTVRDVDTYVEQRKMDEFGAFDAFTNPMPKKKSNDVSYKLSADGSLTDGRSKKEKIQAKLDEAKYNRDVANRALSETQHKRSTTQYIERNDAELFGGVKRVASSVFGASLGTIYGDSVFPETKAGNAGVIASKIAGGVAGYKLSDKISKDSSKEADGKVDKLTSDEFIDTKAGVGNTSQDIADWKTTVEHWDAQVKKYEGMLSKVEDEELMA